MGRQGDVFPEYYILKVNDFDQVATTSLDEWMEFLKTGQIAPDATAPGLAEARQCLDIDKMTTAERRAYINHMEAVRYQRSVIGTGYDDGLQAGRAEERAKMANVIKSMLAKSMSVSAIADLTGMSVDEIEKYE